MKTLSYNRPLELDVNGGKFMGKSGNVDPRPVKILSRSLKPVGAATPLKSRGGSTLARLGMKFMSLDDDVNSAAAAYATEAIVVVV